MSAAPTSAETVLNRLEELRSEVANFATLESRDLSVRFQLFMYGVDAVGFTRHPLETDLSMFREEHNAIEHLSERYSEVLDKAAVVLKAAIETGIRLKLTDLDTHHYFGWIQFLANDFNHELRTIEEIDMEPGDECYGSLKEVYIPRVLETSDRAIEYLIHKVGEIVDQQQTNGDDKPSRDEANVLAREVLIKSPNISLRDLAKIIRRSLGFVCKLPAWRVVQERKKKAARRKAKTVSFTNKLQAITPDPQQELSRLIAEQEIDMRNEPSPVENNAPALGSHRSSD